MEFLIFFNICKDLPDQNIHTGGTNEVDNCNTMWYCCVTVVTQGGFAMAAVNIPNSEWQVMEELWRGGPMTLMELVRAMERRSGWAKSTTNTTLRRMADKGLVCRRDGGGARMYEAKIGKDEAAAEETESFLKKVYGGSIGMMVASMAGQRALSQSDFEELQAILNGTEGGRK
jgi:BlaI family penicillinase repressor